VLTRASERISVKLIAMLRFEIAQERSA
jgi:hypothetical protein